MKNLHKILFLSFFFITNLILSQDVIELKNGDDIKTKVIEISNTEIKYKKFSNIEGPIYIISKSKIVMIKYENGEKEIMTKMLTNNEKLSISAGYYKDNNKISKREFKKILSTNQKAYNEYKSGKVLFTLGVITEIIGMGILVGGITTEEKDLVLPGAFTFVGGFGISMIGGSMVKKSVKTYNSSENISYKFKINTNGVGFVINF